ncbi:MAG: ATP-binding protein [Clostridia bacterium]|nr:ATP-binding protein [Clostridia bacterium]
MEIRRDKYLDNLKNRLHNGMIKVVTGVRRSGKSYLVFKLYRNYLLESGVPEDHIIGIALDERKNREYRKADAILAYIEGRLTGSGEYYLLLDEVQLLEDFEEVLNSLLHTPNLDICVTGSNSKFLSRDVITEFRGRGDEIRVYPLSFKEYMSAYPSDRYQGFADYMTYGALPQILSMKTEQQKIQYLTTLFEETYIKDICERNRIEKLQELNDIINVLASAVGSLTNPSKIEATFRSSLRSDISVNTISQYIKYLEDAFLISEANRYDVKGRKYIGTPLKYYFEDTGLRNARLGFRQTEETHLMENVIYNELRMRGYKVDVGVVPVRLTNGSGKRERAQLEIDFVANMGSKKYYLQSAFSLPDENKTKQEKASLLNVDDSFKKLVIVNDTLNVRRDEHGITTMNLYDFLLNENSLDI